MSVYQREQLSNGLRVLTAPLDHAPALHVAGQDLARRGEARAQGAARAAGQPLEQARPRRPRSVAVGLPAEDLVLPEPARIDAHGAMLV